MADGQQPVSAELQLRKRIRARVYWWTFRHYRNAPFDSRRATFWWRLGCRIESKPHD